MNKSDKKSGSTGDGVTAPLPKPPAKSGTVAKTVFISYRPAASQHLALLIAKSLDYRGYDVYMDLESIDSDTYETASRNQIDARAHFLLLLSPGTVERCRYPNDRVRQEIETAIELKRNIIPVLIDDFSFSMAMPHLTDQLAQLYRFNALRYERDFHEQGIAKLHEQFLSIPVDVDVIPPHPVERDMAQRLMSDALTQPDPTYDEIEAEKHFAFGLAQYEAHDHVAAVEHYDRALEINSQYVYAYLYRGLIAYEDSAFETAIDDFTRASELDRMNAHYGVAHLYRGHAYLAQNIADLALQDYKSFLELGGGERYGNRTAVRDAIQQLSDLPDEDTDTISITDLLRQILNDTDTLRVDDEPDDDTKPDLSDTTEPLTETEMDGVPQSVLDGVTRPLPLETVIAARNDRLTFGQSTDVGAVRNNNQDAMYTFYASSSSVGSHSDFGLFIVADGMGGHEHGERASAVVTRTIASLVLSDIYHPIMFSDQNDAVDRPTISETLAEAVQIANERVIDEVSDAGSTVTAVIVMGDLAVFAQVGDSRAYMIHKNDMQQITRDHSLVQRLIELEQLTQEEALHHPQSNVLYRAIGQDESLEVDIITRRLQPGSYLLLCSDGLWGLVDNETILDTVLTNPDPQIACDKLVALANDNGGKDNITVIILHMPS